MTKTPPKPKLKVSPTHNAPIMPVGSTTVADRSGPILTDKQEVFINESMEVAENTHKTKKQNIWYVLVLYFEASEGDFSIGRPVYVWYCAYTKSFARDIARDLLGKGYEVVDIVQGSKKHMMHQWRGVRELKKRR